MALYITMIHTQSDYNTIIINYDDLIITALSQSILYFAMVFLLPFGDSITNW